MQSPEKWTRAVERISPWPRRASLAGVWMLALITFVPRSSHAEPPPPVSEREAERQRLLDQLGLKKRAPVAPERGAGGEADREKKTEKETEKATTERDEAQRASERPSPGRGTTDAKDQAGLVFSGAVHRALLGACQSCHNPGGVAASSAFVLSGALDADFAATQRQVNAGPPGRTPLLRKASGAGHAGGAVLREGAAEYQLLARWISEGAKRGAVAPVAPPAAPDAAIPALGAPAAVARSATLAPTGSPRADAPVPEAASMSAVAGPEAVSRAGRLDYAPIVHDALNQACSGCHRSGALAGNTGYVLSGEAAADFASARRFVDLEAPEASSLLLKASGAGHAGGAIYPPGADAYLRLLQWIQFGALGPTEAAARAAPGASPPEPDSAPARAPGTPGPALPDRSTVDLTAAPGKGLSLPWNFRLNGRFDLNYERRNFDTQPFSAGDDAIQSYHHFIFLSRQAQGDPVGFSAELINLTFWEVTYHLSLPESAGKLWIKAGKVLVPFGPDPLFHQSYGGLAGFDQRVLPVIWAQEGVSARFSREQGDVSGSADLYAVRGHALKQREAVLNLQSDLSPVDDARVAIGARLRASWKAVSLFYSGYVNGLGFGRLLYLQAADVGIWRWRGVPVLEQLAAEVGLLRADVSGAGPGRDYYHFASYFRLRYFLTDSAYLQYRQGLRTFDNRRGVILDDTRLTSEDGSTHGLGLVSRYGPLTLGLYYYLNLEKADEVKDDFLRVTGVYEF
jgi:hypothetical protein